VFGHHEWSVNRVFEHHGWSVNRVFEHHGWSVDTVFEHHGWSVDTVFEHHEVVQDNSRGSREERQRRSVTHGASQTRIHDPERVNAVRN